MSQFVQTEPDYIFGSSRHLADEPCFYHLSCITSLTLISGIFYHDLLGGSYFNEVRKCFEILDTPCHCHSQATDQYYCLLLGPPLCGRHKQYGPLTAEPQRLRAFFFSRAFWLWDDGSLLCSSIPCLLIWNALGTLPFTHATRRRWVEGRTSKGGHSNDVRILWSAPY